MLYEGLYIQKKTKKKDGCQIDYMIQTRGNMLYVCEVKVLSGGIGKDIIKEVQEKIRRLSIPREMAAVPVLIFSGKLSLEVYKSGYFYKIIDIQDLIEG